MSTVDTSFATHQGKAIDRQDYAYAVLNDVFDGLSSFVDHEGEDVSIDAKGIDASITTADGDLKFVALKTRANHKRPLDQLDLGLRVAGRNGKRSEEWERFSDPEKPVPHLLVFLLFDVRGDQEECVEMIVVDFRHLKNIYHLGMEETEEHWRIGEVRVREHSPIGHFGPIDACAPGDDGVFMFLNKEDIVNSPALIAHWVNH